MNTAYLWMLTAAVLLLNPGPGAAEGTNDAPARTPCKTVQRAMAGQHQHIVAYGTSLTWAGSWVEKLRSALNRKETHYAFTLSNAGMNSKASNWGVTQIEERVLKRNPDAVFLEFAINDGDERHGLSLEQSRVNLESMIDRIARHNPDCDVILLVTNPVTRPDAVKFRPRLDQYYQVVRDVARERGLLVVDMYPAWETLLKEEPDKFQRYVPDGLHPGTEGDAKVIVPAICRAMGL